MTRNRWIFSASLSLVALIVTWTTLATGQSPPPVTAEPLKLLEPKPLVSGAKVVTLCPAGSPILRPLAGWDKPEVFNMSKGKPNKN